MGVDQGVVRVRECKRVGTESDEVKAGLDVCLQKSRRSSALQAAASLSLRWLSPGRGRVGFEDSAVVCCKRPRCEGTSWLVPIPVVSGFYCHCGRCVSAGGGKGEDMDIWRE